MYNNSQSISSYTCSHQTSPSSSSCSCSNPLTSSSSSSSSWRNFSPCSFLFLHPPRASLFALDRRFSSPRSFASSARLSSGSYISHLIRVLRSRVAILLLLSLRGVRTSTSFPLPPLFARPDGMPLTRTSRCCCCCCCCCLRSRSRFVGVSVVLVVVLLLLYQT